MFAGLPLQRVLPELSRTRPLHHDADEEHESGVETLCEVIMAQAQARASVLQTASFARIIIETQGHTRGQTAHKGLLISF